MSRAQCSGQEARAPVPVAADLDRALALLGRGHSSAVCESQLLELRGDGPVVPVCLLRFDAAAFTPDMFATFGLERPARVAASVHKRQAEFFHGRLAARAAMLMQGLPVREVPIGEHRQPGWPEGLVGSISHTSSWAAAAVVADRAVSGVGIDIEAIVSAPDASEALRQTVVDDREFECLAALPLPYDLDTRLTLAFSAKEAFFKAAFVAVGRFFDFSAVRVRTVDAPAGTLDLEVRESLCAAFVPGRRCRVEYRVLGDAMLLTAFAW